MLRCKGMPKPGIYYRLYKVGGVLLNCIYYSIQCGSQLGCRHSFRLAGYAGEAE